MKKFLINILKFLPLAALVYLMLLFIFGSFAPAFLRKNVNYKVASYGHLYSRVRDADTSGHVDVLVLGSSHSYRGYDPRIFNKAGISLFNLGSSAQTPVQSELLAEQYLEKLSPRLVIFDIYPALFTGDGVESSLDLISNTNLSQYKFFSLAFRTNNIKVYNTLLYKSLRNGVFRNEKIVEPQKRGADTYIKGGYIETYAQSKTKEARDVPSEYVLIDKQLKAFESVLLRLRERNIKVLLIQAPIMLELYSKKTNNAQMDSLFSTYGKYVNFNEMLNLPDSMFVDDNHLNQYGVNVFNAEVLKLVKESLPLPSKGQ